MNAATDERRSLFRRREQAFAELPDVAAIEELRAGGQPAGFTVSSVPDGWTVISSTAYDFVIA